MFTSRTTQLQKARQQVGSIVEQLDLDTRAREVADRAGMMKRKRKLGIPYGRKHADWGRIASYGAAAVVGMVGSKALRSNGHATSGDAGSGDDAAARDAENGATRDESDTA